MRKKKGMVIVIMIILAAVVVGVTVVSQSPRWSEKSFEAIVQEAVIQPDGATRLMIERTTEVYGSPVNSLGISEDTFVNDKNSCLAQSKTDYAEKMKEKQAAEKAENNKRSTGR